MVQNNPAWSPPNNFTPFTIDVRVWSCGGFIAMLGLDNLYCFVAGVARVLQQEGTEPEDADAAQGSRDQDGEHRQGEDLLSHPQPLSLVKTYIWEWIEG